MQDIERRSQQLEKVARETASLVVPAVDIFEGADETWVVADLPGVSRAALHVEIENDELRFDADADGFDGAPLHFARAFRIPLGVDPAKVMAEMKDGVLTLKLPKPAEMKPAPKIDPAVARRQVFEDLLWALINGKEFVFNH